MNWLFQNKQIWDIIVKREFLIVSQISALNWKNTIYCEWSYT